MRYLQWCTPVGLVLGLAATPALAGPAEVDRALGMVPADAHAAILVPDVKRLNDRLTELLQRMERPELLAGGRPIDMVKGWFGLGAALDENASAVGFLRSIDGQPVPTLVLTTTDPKAFLEGNFNRKPDTTEPDTWLTLDGSTVYAKVVENRVALSSDARGVRTYELSSESAGRMRTRLGEKGGALLAKGDVLMWSDAEGAKMAAARRSAMPAAVGLPIPMNELDGMNDVVVAIDFDPLGLMARSWASFDPTSRMGGLTSGGSENEGSSNFSRIPDAPFYTAIAVDLIGLGRTELLSELLPGVELPSWLAHATGAQLGVFPSKLGVAVGGVLNDAALVVETSQSDELVAAMKSEILARRDNADGVMYEGVWEDEKALKSGTVAQAFEVKETVVAAPAGQDFQAEIKQLARRMIFGQRGFHGLVKATTDAVVMTFSQRPDVFDRAFAAATGGAGLSANEMIKAMRGYLLPDADIEMFISFGQIARLAKQVTGMIPGASVNMPDIDPAIEPIGIAVEVQSSTVEGALVVPAGVIAAMYDQAKAQMMPPPPAASPAR